MAKMRPGLLVMSPWTPWPRSFVTRWGEERVVWKDRNEDDG